ncbi:response regulator [Polynucleobacter sp. Latsch14-2]|jgi:excisionase family DNA binding protein|uniref:response regulator n=1 Tax=Polynucleobacter sp. Latsch14-2 TaxID=2576920 RepID=UPI001C0A9A26|nr:response regulator [Polynucleobacter sp. Latsch14-2]MBU3615365.1 response regulator [Polynucleobacter sp. Latsch14-2]
MSSEDAYVSTREAADLLGISLRTAQLWVESGVLLAWKTSGGHRRILRQSVDALLAERARQSGAVTKKSTATDALKVVVVEDDQDLLRLIELSLSDLPRPTEVRSAKDGFAGLVLIGQFLPDLVIADLNMPGMDGFRMIQSLIGSEFAPTKIIVSTALSPAGIELKGGLPDSIEILQKPYSLELLEEKVLGMIKR